MTFIKKSLLKRWEYRTNKQKRVNKKFIDEKNLFRRNKKKNSMIFRRNKKKKETKYISI